MACGQDVTADAVLLLDSRGEVLSLNSEARRVTGYSTADLIGRLVPSRVLVGDPTDAAIAPILARAATESWVKDQGTCYRKDGTAFPATRLVIAQRTNTGALRGFVLLVHDTTPLRELQAAQRRAAEATAELLRIKSEFLANMSHELRTPLNAIMGYADMALDGAHSDDERRPLDGIRASAENMLGLILNLLDAARLNGGQLELERTPFSLRDTLRDVLVVAAPRAHHRGLELCCDVRPDVPDRLQGSPGRLGQIFAHLLDNATKFTETGEIVVRVAAGAGKGAETCMYCTVSDTGIGIPSEKQGLVFEPFVQVDGSMQRRYAGAGLGLTIARHIVELMGGNIWLSGEFGHGTTVHFTVPLPIGEAYRVPSGPRLRGRALIADDNATTRNLLAETVTRAGLVPTLVEDASSALAALAVGGSRGCPFEVALIDADLPLTDGTPLGTRLHRHRMSRTPIVLLVSPNYPSQMLEYRTLKVAAYVAKPVLESVLRGILHSTLQSTVELMERLRRATRCGSSQAIQQ
jgi:PAS domain S-box-containing protein